MDLVPILRDPKGFRPGRRAAFSQAEGRFIYCVIERGDEDYPSCLPPSDGRPVCHCTGRQVTGLEGARLETISYVGIAAVVSPLRATSFDQLKKEAVKEFILKHQEVNSRIFSTRTVVPVRFGTIADDPVQVKEQLQKIYLQVKAGLKRLEGKVELVVRASWNLHAVLLGTKSEIPIEDSGAIDLQQRIAIGRRVFEAVDKRKKTIVNTIHNRLYPVAVDFTVGRPDGE